MHMKFISSSSTRYLTRETSSWPLEDKIHIHARACNILYISDKTPHTNKEEIYQGKVTARDVLSTIWSVNGFMNS